MPTMRYDWETFDRIREAMEKALNGSLNGTGRNTFHAYAEAMKSKRPKQPAVDFMDQCLSRAAKAYPQSTSAMGRVVNGGVEVTLYLGDDVCQIVTYHGTFPC